MESPSSERRRGKARTEPVRFHKRHKQTPIDPKQEERKHALLQRHDQLEILRKRSMIGSIREQLRRERDILSAQQQCLHGCYLDRIARFPHLEWTIGCSRSPASSHTNNNTTLAHLTQVGYAGVNAILHQAHTDRIARWHHKYKNDTLPTLCYIKINTILHQLHKQRKVRHTTNSLLVFLPPPIILRKSIKLPPPIRIL